MYNFKVTRDTYQVSFRYYLLYLYILLSFSKSGQQLANCQISGAYCRNSNNQLHGNFLLVMERFSGFEISSPTTLPFLVLCIHSFAFSNLCLLKAILILQASLDSLLCPCFLLNYSQHPTRTFHTIEKSEYKTQLFTPFIFLLSRASEFLPLLSRDLI